MDEGEENGNGTKEKNIFRADWNNHHCLSDGKYLFYWTNRNDWKS